MASDPQKPRGCIDRLFEGIGCTVGLIGGAVYGYFQDPANPVISAALYGGIFAILGGVIGRLVPVLLVVAVIALIILVIKMLQG